MVGKRFRASRERGGWRGGWRGQWIIAALSCAVSAAACAPPSSGAGNEAAPVETPSAASPRDEVTVHGVRTVDTTGLGRRPRLTMEPVTAAFGSVALGLASAPMTFTVTNRGGGACVPVSETVSDTTDFAVTDEACLGRLLGVGTSCTLSVRFTPSVTTGAKAATLTVTATHGGTVTSSLSGTATIALADLSVQWLVDNPRKVLAGDDVTYTIRVHNAGPDPATDAVVTDTLAASATPVLATASSGSCSSAGLSGRTLTCELGTLASGADATVTIVATAGVIGEMTNRVSVASGVVDPASDNNSAVVPPSVCASETPPAGTDGDGPICPASCQDGMVGTVGDACSCAGWAMASGFCCSGPCCSGTQGDGSCTEPSCGGTCQASVPTTMSASQILVVDRTTVVSTITGVTSAVAIPRSAAISLRYTNNSVTSQNGGGYILEAGTELPSAKDNHLDGSVITGNRLTWTGSDLTAITHGLFVGYGINHTIAYNFLKDTPYGVVTKSSGMTFTSGGVAYNIVTNSVQGAAAKGINDVKFYNNTFFNVRPPNAVTALIRIYENHDLVSPGPPSTNAQVMNNIFYTRAQVPNIMISEASRPGFRSDFNDFFCESGEPIFVVEGEGTLTFTEWQALGYDTHSVIVDPHFVDTESLIPAAPLNFGTDLGVEWRAGLSPTTAWGSDPILSDQGDTWQCGAYVVM